MANFLHEWRMNRKIKRILAYNEKHPEQCFDLGKFVAKEGIQPSQGDLRAQSIIEFIDNLKSGRIE